MSSRKRRSSATDERRMDMRAPPSLLPLELDQRRLRGRRPAHHRWHLADDSTRVRARSSSARTARARACCCDCATGCLSRRRARFAWNAPEPAGGPRRQAMVFQRPVLLRRSALANIALRARDRGRAARAATSRERWTRCAGSGSSASPSIPARVLSGGEQQRLALARAWALASGSAVSRRADRESRSRRDARDRTRHRRDARERAPRS